MKEDEAFEREVRLIKARRHIAEKVGGVFAGVGLLFVLLFELAREYFIWVSP